VTNSLLPLLQDSFTQRESLGSDHGPCGIILDLKVEVEEKPIYKKPEIQPALF